MSTSSKSTSIPFIYNIFPPLLGGVDKWRPHVERAVLGKRLLQKVTLRTVQRIVAGMLLLVGAGLVTGLI